MVKISPGHGEWGNVQKIMELEGDGQNKAYYMNKPSPITLLFTNLGRH